MSNVNAANKTLTIAGFTVYLFVNQMVKKLCPCWWSKKTAVSVAAIVLVVMLVGLVGEVM